MSAAKKLTAQSELTQLVAKELRGHIHIYCGDQKKGKKKTDPNKDIFVVNEEAPQKLLKEVLNSNARHFVQENSVNLQRGLNFSALMLKDPDLFFKRPLDCIFNPKIEGKRPPLKQKLEIEFNSSKKKKDILSQLQTFVASLTKSKTFSDDVTLAADELITNAIFNAPFVTKENKVEGVDRQVPVTMTDGLTGTFFAGTDGEQLVIGCRDPYGSLNLTKLLKRIHDCYAQGVAASINMERGGAGIGSFLVFDHCTEYYAAVHPDKYTVICCAFPLNMNSRRRQEMKKNIHYYIREEQGE